MSILSKSSIPAERQPGRSSRRAARLAYSATVGFLVAVLLARLWTRYLRAHLLHAVLANRPAEVERLLAWGADPNMRLDAGMAAGPTVGAGDPIITVAPASGTKVTAELLAHGAGVNETTQDGQTALQRAILYGSAETVTLLLRHRGRILSGAEADCPLCLALEENRGAASMAVLAADPPRTTRLLRLALGTAVAAGNSRVAHRLVALGAPVNGIGFRGESPLLSAIRGGDPASVRLLVEHGAALRQGETSKALGWACYFGFAPLARLLARRGGDPNYTDSEGWNAVRAAVHSGNPALLKMLFSHGAKADTPPSRQALVEAAQRGQSAMVRALLNRGASPASTGQGGLTAIGAAVDSGSVATLRCLLASGGGSAGSAAGAALREAANGSSVRMAKLLLKGGAPVNSRNEAGWSALMISAGRGSLPLVQLLLSYGARTDFRNMHGKSVFDIAAHAPFVSRNEALAVLEKAPQRRLQKNGTAYH